LDAQFRQRYPFGPMAACQPPPPGLPIVIADTVAELATRCGIDPHGLEMEVERFNALVRRGQDDDFHRGERPWSRMMIGDPHSPNPNLGDISQPPFCAVQLRSVGSGMGSAGLATDAAARVVGYDGAPLGGLYAAGNTMALQDLGGCYQSGLANSRGMIFAYLAAVDAMQRHD
jgi:3-oxosteroid 1-dehydrogenase